MRFVRKSLSSLLGLSFSVCVLNISLSLAQQSTPNRDVKTTSATGRSTFNSYCSGCHGLDGRGSDKAVNIAATDKVRLSDAELSTIISNGIPGTGMPAFRTLSEKQIRAVVGYVRLLQGKTGIRTVPGDAKRGKEIFFGKGGCSSCHTISGEGGFLGPDLSGYASGGSANAIRDEIVRSPRIPAQGFRTAVLTTTSGERLEGVVRNEDNFSVQFQTKDGGFHFFQKADLRNFEHLDSSLMPTNYRERLSNGELDDLVSYLLVISDEKKAITPRKKKDDAE